MKNIKYALILFVLVALYPARSLAQSVSYERILHSQSEPGSWLTYSGSSPRSSIRRSSRSTARTFQV